MIEVGANFIARPYRGVSVQDAAGLDERTLREWLIGRRVYRRTEFIVAAGDGEHAVVQVSHAVGEDVLATVEDVRVLDGPIAFIADPSVDTANASQMARAALTSRRRSARVHRPGTLRARELHRRAGSDPGPRARGGAAEPPKLLEMARAVVDYDEDLPPVQLTFAPIDLRSLAAAPGRRYLFPCRCSGLERRTVDFLDAGPPEPADWTLIGCERSRQIHVALYGREPADRVDFCPRVRRPRRRTDAAQVLPARARDRALRRRDRRAVGGGARRGPARRCASCAGYP